MTDIQPQLLSLGKLLTGRLFRIPEYQRAYSWQTKQRRDLFDDIEELVRANREGGHFMATIVGLRRDTVTIMADDHHVIEIVDGQQRMTTLIILLKSILLNLDHSDNDQKAFAERYGPMLVKMDKVTLLLLQTNHDQSSYYSNFIREGLAASVSDAATVADRCILEAIAESDKFVKEWVRSKGALTDLIRILLNKLTFVFHEISDESTVYTVFEVLNSRGLDVSWFDRLKSMLMAKVFDSETGNQKEIIDEVHGLWATIYREIGLRLGLSTEALRFAATLKTANAPSKNCSESESAELLSSLAGNDSRGVIDVTKWILKVTYAVDRLHEDRRRNAVTKISQARLVAVSILLRDDFNDDDKSRLLRCWENVSFRIYGLHGKDSRTKVGDYIRLAWGIYNNGLSLPQVMARLSMIGEQFPIESAIEAIRGADCYSDWAEEARYFLFRYEEYLAREQGQLYNEEQWNKIWMESASDSIEHILAQSLGQEEVVHRIGNLILLPPRLNSKLNNKVAIDKRDAYDLTGLLLAKEVVPNLGGWGLESIVQRENHLLDWARREWGD